MPECHFACVECTGPNPNDCVSCKSPLTKLPSTGQCCVVAHGKCVCTTDIRRLQRLLQDLLRRGAERLLDLRDEPSAAAGQVLQVLGQLLPEPAELRAYWISLECEATCNGCTSKEVCKDCHDEQFRFLNPKLQCLCRDGYYEDPSTPVCQGFEYSSVFREL